MFNGYKISSTPQTPLLWETAVVIFLQILIYLYYKLIFKYIILISNLNDEINF